jgi:membrane protein
VVLLAAKPLYNLTSRLPPQDFWDNFAGIMADIAIALFLPWLLLAGAVRPRLLLPGALLFATVMGLIRPFATRYLPQALETSADHYGALGVAFTYLAWLYVLAFCFLLTGIMGAVITGDPSRFGTWIRGEKSRGDASAPDNPTPAAEP